MIRVGRRLSELILSAGCLTRDVLAYRRDPFVFAGADEKTCRFVARLHGLTNGFSTDFIFRTVEGKRDQSCINSLGSSSEPVDFLDEARHYTKTLERDGFVVFPYRLSIDECSDLQRLSCSASTDIFAVNGAFQGSGLYNPSERSWSSYHVQLSSLLNYPGVQRILAASFPRAVAAVYLGHSPISPLTKSALDASGLV